MMVPLECAQVMVVGVMVMATLVMVSQEVVQVMVVKARAVPSGDHQNPGAPSPHTLLLHWDASNIGHTAAA